MKTSDCSGVLFGGVEVYIMRPSANLNIKWVYRKSNVLNFFWECFFSRSGSEPGGCLMKV